MPERGTPRTAYRSEPAGDLPDGLVLFDGVCVLCSGWVRFILPRDTNRRFHFASIQGRYGRQVAARLGIDSDEPQTNAVVLGGRVHFKSESALAVLGELPGWGWTRLARLAPRPVRDWCYDRIARNRYHLFGCSDACMAPTADVRDRFFD